MPSCYNWTCLQDGTFMWDDKFNSKRTNAQCIKGCIFWASVSFKLFQVHSLIRGIIRRREDDISSAESWSDYWFENSSPRGGPGKNTGWLNNNSMKYAGNNKALDKEIQKSCKNDKNQHIARILCQQLEEQSNIFLENLSRRHK